MGFGQGENLGLSLCIYFKVDLVFLNLCFISLTRKSAIIQINQHYWTITDLLHAISLKS